jgi:hypothetical protein
MPSLWACAEDRVSGEATSWAFVAVPSMKMPAEKVYNPALCRGLKHTTVCFQNVFAGIMLKVKLVRA